MSREYLINSTFSASDAAFALGHGDFNNWRRNLTKLDLLILPRVVRSGPGAEYRYAHLVELALQMHVGAAFSREAAKHLTFRLFLRLWDNDTGLRKYNSLSQADRDALDRHGFDQPLEGGLPQLSVFVDNPELVLSADLVSRDLSAPTFILFNPTRVAHSGRVQIVTGGTSLSDAYTTFVERETANAANDRVRESIEETCFVPGIVNLTAILVRLDEMLEMRREAHISR